MISSVYSYQNYQIFLRDFFNQNDGTSPSQAQLARFLNCQSSFISQVLSQKAHLSLEHAIQVADFLELNENEKRFFLLLVQKAKAGTKSLQEHFLAEMRILKENTEVIRDKIKVKSKLNEADQSIYYSQWWYSAIHILVALPNFNTITDLKKCLNLPQKIIEESVHFLLECGLIIQKGKSLEIGHARIHLGSKSKLISRHHMNWREKSLEILAARRDENLHFTGVIGISSEGADKLRNLILALIKESEEIVEKTKEEHAYLFAVDFFGLDTTSSKSAGLESRQ